MTDPDAIARDISQFIQQNFLFDSRAVDPEEPLLASGTVDSTGVMELLGHIEQQYNVTFKDEELVGENFESVKKIAAFVSAKLST